MVHGDTFHLILLQLPTLSLILITFSSSTFFLQQSFLSFPLIPSSPSLRSLPHLPPSPAQAESGEPPLPAGPASFGCGAASCGPAPAGTGGPASHRRHAWPGAGYMAGAGKICPHAQLGVGGGRRPTAWRVRRAQAKLAAWRGRVRVCPGRSRP